MVAGRTGHEGRGFVCPHCGRRYGDPLYHGPAGHAPGRMCFDCWASEWGQMELVMRRGGDWQPMDAALFLLCQGFSHRQAARIVGVARKTVYNWIRRLRREPQLVPDWLRQRAEAAGLRKEKRA